MKQLLIGLFLLSSISIFSQNTPIGEWTDHLSYSGVNSLAYDGTEVYCGTNTGMYSYNLSDNSLERYSSINILSDINIQLIEYNSATNTICIYYENGNIDFIKNGKTMNVSFFQKYTQIQDKTINSIFTQDEFAYLACNFGILKINVSKKEISETILFNINGSNLKVNAVTILNNNIYAATQNGLYKANVNSNLLDFNSWVKDNNLNQDIIENVFVFNNELYVLTNDSGQAFLQLVNNTWSSLPSLLIGEKVKKIKAEKSYIQVAYKTKIIEYNTLLQPTSNIIEADFSLLSDFVKVSENRFFTSNTSGFVWEFKDNQYIQTVNPSGPPTSHAYDIAADNGKIWVIRGGINSSYGNQYQPAYIYYFDGAKWLNLNSSTHNELSNKYDIVKITRNKNIEGNLIFSTWGAGIIEMIDFNPSQTIDESNSTLVNREDAPGMDWVGSGGAEFDKEGNLWVGNSYSTKSISVRKTDGSWKSFDFNGYLAPSAATTDIEISEAGYKWLVSPRDNSIVVFDDNGTIDDISDDRKIKLTRDENRGNIPGSRGLNIAIDKNDDVWLGTDAGLAIFYNATNIFDAENKDAQSIIISQGENNEALFSDESIKAIQVDGANRKWIATESNGVFLMSPDGKKEIYNFKEENSPLLSNNVFSLAIDNKTGEVYFGTDKGIISFRAEATEGQPNYSNVKIFPNPVRPDYTGPIAINGLIENSIVKITDINGTLINEVQSLGGQAIWNGTNFNGERAKTGVYLIFNSAMGEGDKLKTHVGKILFVN